MNYKALGERIRNERIRLHLTQEKLAEAVSISTAYVGQIERGERSLTLDKLVTIANHLNVTVDYLLSDYIPVKDDNTAEIWQQITKGKSEEDKAFIIDMLKTLCQHIGRKK